jgi:hypothetical protein
MERHPQLAPFPGCFFQQEAQKFALFRTMLLQEQIRGLAREAHQVNGFADWW